MKKITAYQSNDGEVFVDAAECAAKDNMVKCKRCKSLGKYLTKKMFILQDYQIVDG